ncbi:MAG: LacI family DNA-binding transcriptional regulator [Thermomicrobiales bacterium]|nr:LacI family DNA-binding transcriptional regulator [Thermomicrobiales bacterium]
MPARNDAPTIKDVARAAGVSVSTVSRVLNNKADVSPSAREAVRRALALTSYTASPIARSLVGGKTRLIGLYAGDPTQEYAAGLCSGVFDTCEAAGYGVLWFATDFTSQEQSVPLLRTLIDGLIVVSPTLDSEAEIARLESGRPVVLIEPSSQQAAHVSVTVSNQAGAAEATRYLLGLGHRRIGFVTGRLNRPSSHERLAGFREAMAEAEAPVDDTLIVEGAFDQESGLAAGRYLLSLPERPTAIFASDDAEAFGVLWAAREAGLRVPDELSVVGFDDVPMAERVQPALTTVRQPLREMGQRAARILIDWVDGSVPEPRQQVFPAHLVVRESCAPARAT